MFSKMDTSGAPVNIPTGIPSTVTMCSASSPVPVPLLETYLKLIVNNPGNKQTLLKLNSEEYWV